MDNNTVGSIWICLTAGPCYDTNIQARIEKKANSIAYHCVFAETSDLPCYFVHEHTSHTLILLQTWIEKASLWSSVSSVLV